MKLRFPIFWRYALALLYVLSAWPKAASALEYTPVTLGQLRPSASTADVFDGDGPYEAWTLAPDGGLWLMGKTSLWSWYPLTANVKRYDLSQQVVLFGPHRAIAAVDRSIVFAVNGRVWRFVPSELKLSGYAGTWPQTCDKLEFIQSPQDSQVLLRGDCGLMRLDFKNLRLSKLNVPAEMISAHSLTFLSDSDELVGADGKQLLKFSLRNSTYKSAVIYQAKSQIQGVRQTGDLLAVWTSQALMGFDAKTYRRLQVVPVVNSRRIAGAVFEGDRHVVQFSDNTMELMSPLQKRAWTTKLQVAESDGMIVDPGGAFLVLKTKPSPTVLSLEWLNRHAIP